MKPQDEIQNESPVSRFWGKVPVDWKLVPGSSVYTVNPNPKPESEPCTYIEMDALDEELPWPQYFGERRATDYSGKTFRAGDTLMARITPCTENGKAALVPKLPTEVGIGSTEYAVLSPDIDRINPWYLYYLTKSHPVHDYAIARMRGSTGRQRVPFSVFRHELDVPLAPLEEQRKIASLLYTVDELIERTEAVIRSLRRVKRGVRQRLLEHGTGDEPRIDSGTRYGKLPTSWVVRHLDEVVDVVGGTTPSTDEEAYWGGEIAWATPSDLTDLEGPTIDATPRRITEQAVEDCALTVLPTGSVLLTSRASIGKCAINTVPMATNQGFQSLVPGDDVDEWYLLYLVEESAEYLNSLGTGSTFREISNSMVKTVQVPIPPEPKQREIAQILRSVDQAIVANRRYQWSVNEVKQGGMQDLLSGDVRTDGVDIEIPKEVAAYG